MEFNDCVNSRQTENGSKSDVEIDKAGEEYRSRKFNLLKGKLFFILILSN